jgi:hypothetical protein
MFVWLFFWKFIMIRIIQYWMWALKQITDTLAVKCHIITNVFRPEGTSRGFLQWPQPIRLSSIAGKSHNTRAFQLASSAQCCHIAVRTWNRLSIWRKVWTIKIKMAVLHKGPSINIPQLNGDTNSLKWSCRNAVSLKEGFSWFKYSSMVDILKHIVNPPVPKEQGNCTQLERLLVSQ